jgi:hypothetical protein
LFLLRVLLLLHHPDCGRVMYCYSTFLFHYSYSYYYSSTHFCQLDFSEMPWSNSMKPCRNIICHVKLCLKKMKNTKMIITGYFFNPSKAATYYGGYSYKVSWSLNPPLFCFHGNCGKVCPTHSDFFWLISFH